MPVPMKEITGIIVEMDMHNMDPDVEMLIKVMEDTPTAEILHKVAVPLGLGYLAKEYFNTEGVVISVEVQKDRLVLGDAWEQDDSVVENHEAEAETEE